MITIDNDEARMPAAAFVRIQHKADALEYLIDNGLELRREGDLWRVWRNGAPIGFAEPDALRAISGSRNDLIP